VNVVVVGNGMAGARFVHELITRDLDRRLQVTVVGDEPGAAYNRIQLSNVLAGVRGADGITLASVAWYAQQNVTLRSGIAVVGVDRVARTVQLDDGSALPYDVLVLATGSAAVLPEIAGLRTSGDALVDGAVAFRTLADCVAIDRLARQSRRALVLGAGVLGLEAARGLAGRGVPVTLLQRGSRLMERELDQEASRVLGKTVARFGIDVIGGVDVRAVLGGGDRFTGLELSDGRELAADLLVLCCGVRPRIELAVRAGLAGQRGVLVDDELRSVSDPAVFAIGECAQHRGRTYGLVAPAWEQARVAASVIASVTPLRYEGSLVLTRLKAAGIELAAMGDAHIADDDATADIVRFVDGARGIYQKLVVRDGRLVGAILLGDTRTIGTITALFDRGATVPTDRAALLMVRRAGAPSGVQSPVSLPGHATICQCNGVTKAAICDAWQDGARTAGELAACTRVTTGCGTCRDVVDGLLEWLAAADAEPREQPLDSGLRVELETAPV
jgi:assimilatory nitrate reductase electron transfer subunit